MNMAAPDDPEFAPALPDLQQAKAPKFGSLYLEDQSISLYADAKSFQVGDIITVRLQESTSASKEASTNVSKEFNTTTTSPNLFNSVTNFSLPKFFPLQNTSQNQLQIDNVDSETEFSGNGGSDQSNSLTGDITVTVAQILPNKNLSIRGEKWITLNQGSEYIRLTGYIRPKDIGPDNTVLSTRVANARITYSGKGSIADSNTAGWLARFFNSPIWPF